MEDKDISNSEPVIRSNKKILVVVSVCVLLVFPVSLTLFDILKDPLWLTGDIDYGLFGLGYNIVCYADLGMQLCVIPISDYNEIRYNDNNLVLQSVDSECLNVYLSTPEKTTDLFGIVNGTACQPSLEFPENNGWSRELVIVSDVGQTYELMKTKKWWDRSNCPDDKFCNWWLEL